MRKDLVHINSQNIDRLIRQAGLKRTDICKELDIPFVTLRRWLSGQTSSIKRTNAEALSRCLECDIEEITITTADTFSTDERTILEQSKVESSRIAEFVAMDSWSSLSFLLKNFITKNSGDLIKAKGYYWIGMLQYFRGNLSTAIECGKVVLKIGAKYKDAELEACGGNLLGLCYVMKGDSQAVPLLLKVIDNPIVSLENAHACSHLSMWYLSILDLENSVKYGIKALAFGEKIPESKFRLLNQCYVNALMCLCYHDKNDIHNEAFAIERLRLAALKTGWKRMRAFYQIFYARFLTHEGDYVAASSIYYEGLAHFPKNDLFYPLLQVVGIEIQRKSLTININNPIYHEPVAATNITHIFYYREKAAVLKLVGDLKVAREHLDILNSIVLSMSEEYKVHLSDPEALIS